MAEKGLRRELYLTTVDKNFKISEKFTFLTHWINIYQNAIRYIIIGYWFIYAFKYQQTALFSLFYFQAVTNSEFTANLKDPNGTTSFIISSCRYSMIITHIIVRIQ